MKKLTLALIILLPIVSKASNITSTGAGGNWNAPATWVGGIVPGLADNATIAGPVTVTIYTKVNDLTINSGQTLTANVSIGIYGVFTNNGSLSGSADIGIHANGSSFAGAGSFISYSGSFYFQGSNQTIASNVNLVMNSGSIIFSTANTFAPMQITNLGSIALVTGAITNNQPGFNCTWVNGINSTLFIANPSTFAQINDILNASAAGNSIFYTGAANWIIKQPIANTYYNLTFSNGTKTLPSDLILNNLQLNPSGSLNMAGHNITMTGNWTNNETTGAITNNTGIVTFSNSSIQTIGGTHTTRFANMTISGNGGVTITKNCSFTGALTISGSGNFTGPGIDTLISTAGATARVAQITGSGTITANFVVQRYNGRATAQYQALSSPVQSTTLGDWNTSNRNPKFYMSGVGGPDGNAGSYVSVYIYGETTNTYNPVTNFRNPGINYILPQGQGIYLWMGNSLVTMSPFTYITHGVPSVKNISCNVSFTPGQGNGFNIIGNPYPSPIDWASFQASNASLQNTFYLFEQDGSWHTFNGGSIPMEQGFGVVTSSTTSLSFQESHKTNVDAALQRMVDPSNEANAVTFTLSNDLNSFACPTILAFGSNYAKAYNSLEDAIFISSFVKEVPTLYTFSGDNRSLALNRMPDNDSELYIPLTAIGNVAANYTLSSKNINSLSSYNCVCLIDKNTGTILNNFEDNTSYSFAISQPGQQKDYLLLFKRLAPGENCVPTTSALITEASDNMQIYSTTSGAIISFHLTQAENAVVSAYTLTGQKLINDIQVTAFDNHLNVSLPSTIQVYIIRVETPTGITIKKLYR